MTQTLWTPDRDIPLSVKGQEHMDRRDMQTLEQMHRIAGHYGIELRCTKCGTPFHGLNSGNARVESIFCKCREIKADMGRMIV